MVTVAFLFDRTNGWIWEHFPHQFDDLKKFKVHKTFDADSIRNFDIVFVLGYTKILSGDFLTSNKLILVVHESNVPNGKGFAPVQWQILEGKDEITVSLLEVVEQVDSGDVVAQKKLVFDGTELYQEIRSKQAQATYDVISGFLTQYPMIVKQPQVGEGSFYRKRSPSDSELDLDQTIREQFQLLRVCNNDAWPAFFIKDGQKYVVKIYKES